MGTTCGRHNKRTSPVSMISISRRQMAALWGFKCETADWVSYHYVKEERGYMQGTQREGGAGFQCKRVGKNKETSENVK